MPSELVRISGTVEKLIYQSNDSWYSVCDVCTDENKLITVVGIMPYVSVGEEIEAEGTWVTNKDYGKQFKVETYKKSLPKQKNSILRYLSSGAIKGIGAKIAERIVDQYGEESFDVISNHPDWLVQINGISRKKAYEISNDFKEKVDTRELMTFSGGAISANMAVKICKRWGRNALGIIKENPYLLCTDNYGISFKKADEIAFGLGITSDNAFRIESGIRYALRVFASRDGHTYVPKDTLVDAVSKLLGVDNTCVITALDSNDIKGISGQLIKNVPCVFLNELYFAEMNIAKKLVQLNRSVVSLGDANIEYMIMELEAELGIKYAALQKKAIWECIENGVTVLTGGPGTGKTTVIKALLKIFSRLGVSCALCAPTGRASKRMSEATQTEAKTIHRLLEVSSGGEFSEAPKFMRDSTNPLDDDVIIVDESSMIDVPLMNSLIMALKPGMRLVLIGDTNQLPSVGEGNVLKDIISSENFVTVCLNEIFRQSVESGIVLNAHKINNGEHPDLSFKFDDFFFISRDDEDIPGYIAELCKTRLPKKYGITEGIQVISPTKKGICGTQSLNFVLQNELNPPSKDKAEHIVGVDRTIRVGDRIMQTKNNYEMEWLFEGELASSRGMGVFNGDIGKIAAIYKDEQLAIVNYGEKRVEYQFSFLDEIDLSYAITVHKSQGSEYPIVIIPVSKRCPPMLLTRNLLYTAITRSEKIVILIGDKETFFKMIDNNFQFNRNTNLEMLIKKASNEIH
ncbi:MAG: ATP-dependent RecD-like DNA helicase [Ruminococcaceae bacterium]|nr:ATP-dependent RecD-like DNA helicase [Oscillospiraceae bacterium]